MNYNDSYPNGVYIGHDSQAFYDPSGFVPAADYIVKERDWFIDGINNESFKKELLEGSISKSGLVSYIESIDETTAILNSNLYISALFFIFNKSSFVKYSIFTSSSSP